MFILMGIFLFVCFVIWISIVDGLMTSLAAKKLVMSITLFVVAPVIYLYYYWTNFKLVCELYDFAMTYHEYGKLVREGLDQDRRKLQDFYEFWSLVCIAVFILLTLLALSLILTFIGTVLSACRDRRDGT